MNIEGLQRKLWQRTQKKRFAFFLVADILSVVAAVSLAFLLRFEGTIPVQYLKGGFPAALALVLLSTIPAFVFFRLYSFTWSYVSIGDLLLLARALFTSAFLAGMAFLLLRGEEFFSGFPRSVFLITYLSLFLFMGGLRFSKRVYLQWILGRKNRKEKERTLIVGAGDEGEEILRSILQSQKSNYFPVGFLDTHSSRVGATIHGVRVLGKIEDMVEIVPEYEVETLIVALSPNNSSEIRMAVELGRKAGLQKIQIVPPLSELIGGQISIRSLREVQVEDLLGRAQVALDQHVIKQFIAGKRILVTGAAGSIGAELSRQIARFSPSSLILLDQDETGMFWISRELQERFPQIERHAIVADIRDEQKMRSVLELHNPEIIFHAAAYKHVPLMEV
ncbi:MAG: polysaccharide biosynthesis protein, partial [Patescibacteria group bacterium]